MYSMTKEERKKTGEICEVRKKRGEEKRTKGEEIGKQEERKGLDE